MAPLGNATPISEWCRGEMAVLRMKKSVGKYKIDTKIVKTISALEIMALIRSFSLYKTG